MTTKNYKHYRKPDGTLYRDRGPGFVDIRQAGYTHGWTYTSYRDGADLLKHHPDLVPCDANGVPTQTPAKANTRVAALMAQRWTSNDGRLTWNGVELASVLVARGVYSDHEAARAVLADDCRVGDSVTTGVGSYTRRA